MAVSPDLAPGFHPKPMDGEVEGFEVRTRAWTLILRLLTSNSTQLLSVTEVIDRMHRKLFKPNCALGQRLFIDFLLRS